MMCAMDAAKLIEDLGGPAAVARMTGCRAPSVIEWREKGLVPESKCPAIEAGTNGRYPCEMVRPDLSWGRIPSKQWPHHPKGEPVVRIALRALKAA